ncbi:unnamed protein product [Clonostachys byssicola]|uniref:Uncharacterized protein n=1 Tax=Clonostachys byssicola TaxID=160290 RepID=A0A9N9ULT2_9HYPO|nr:unnamed protein product [Clonostachys byssicola]
MKLFPGRPSVPQPEEGIVPLKPSAPTNAFVECPSPARRLLLHLDEAHDTGLRSHPVYDIAVVLDPAGNAISSPPHLGNGFREQLAPTREYLLGDELIEDAAADADLFASIFVRNAVYPSETLRSSHLGSARQPRSNTSPMRSFCSTKDPLTSGLWMVPALSLHNTYLVYDIALVRANLKMTSD